MSGWDQQHEMSQSVRGCVCPAVGVLFRKRTDPDWWSCSDCDRRVTLLTEAEKREGVRLGGGGGERSLDQARLLLAADAANRRIENCHTEVACPSCGAPVGTRCWPLSGRGYPNKDQHNKHPHRKRWTLVVPAR